MTGDGSENNPYTITDVVELQAIEGDLNANYILGNNIDASATLQWNEGKGFEPIADSSGDFNRGSFSGTLNGDGYSIKNLHIDRPSEDRVALFTGIGSDTLIENLLLVNADISGNIRTGGIVGASWGTIDQSGIKDSNIHGDERVGGIVANANGRQGSLIKNVFVINTAVDGNERIGGICGRDWYGEIRDSFTTYSEIIGDSTSSTTENIYYQNGSSDSIGVQLSRDEMKGSSAPQNMSGLDFDSLWITREDNYPILRDLSIPDEGGDEEPITTEMTGKVVDQHDNPVSSVPLYIASTQQLYLGNELIDQYPDIFPPNPADKLTVTARTETDEDGEYRVDSIPHGNYFVLAVPEPGQDPSERNYNPRLREEIIIHDEPKSVDIVLPSNRPLSSLSSKVEAITTGSQSEIDTTTDLAAKKFVGLSKIGQSELESSIYDYFSISDAMFDDDSEQTLDDRAARANVELLEDGVRDRILDYASDMTPSMEAILGDASEEFLDEEWVQNYENQSPTELVEIGYRKMPFYIDSEKRLNKIGNFIKKK